MATFEVVWARAAEHDLNGIIDYIAADNVSAALNVFEEIKARCGTLSLFPERGRIVPELRSIGVTAYRELILKNWRIIYNIADTRVRVLACIDARRDIEDILFQRVLHPDG